MTEKKPRDPITPATSTEFAGEAIGFMVSHVAERLGKKVDVDGLEPDSPFVRGVLLQRLSTWADALFPRARPRRRDQ